MVNQTLSAAAVALDPGLERLRGYLESDLDAALDGAARHCAQTMQFRTADLVVTLRGDLSRPA
jgi:hypothetical protein